MKLVDSHKINSNHSCYSFTHRIKGVKHDIKIVAYCSERAFEKAWDYVKAKYKELK